MIEFFNLETGVTIFRYVVASEPASGFNGIAVAREKMTAFD
jgi:hypothetical protein